MPIRNYGLKWSFLDGMTGRQFRGPQVKLNEMHGIYALYDRNDRLAYIGRSGEGKGPGIYGRVYAHRIEQKWDFDVYSWFGVLPVSDEGLIMRDADKLTTEELTKNLEALLIYLLEPEWNGNGGTYKRIPRYRQVPV